MKRRDSEFHALVAENPSVRIFERGSWDWLKAALLKQGIWKASYRQADMERPEVTAAICAWRGWTDPFASDWKAEITGEDHRRV